MGDTDNRTLSDSLTNRKYKIPYYQRGYVWTSSQINDLIDDITFVMSEDVSHYFGNIVLSDIEIDDRLEHYNIIDGQQRITTTTIVFSDIYWFADELIKELDDSSLSEQPEEAIETLESIQSDCKRIFLTSDGRELESSNLMLRTAKKQRRMYEDIVLNNPDEREYSPQRYSERMILEAEEEIWRWLEDIHNNSSGKKLSQCEETANKLDAIVNKLYSGFNLTEYIVRQQSEAGRIFGILNDRGKDLNIADKVKSSLIYHASIMDGADNSLIEDIYDAFAYAYEKVASESGGRAEMNKFMKAHWRVFAGVDTDKDLNNLHRIIEDGTSHLDTSKKSEHRLDWIEYYIQSLREIAEGYENIMDFEVSNLSETKIKIKRKHYYFENFASRDFLAIRLSCELFLTESEQLDVLNHIEALSLRVHEIAKRGANTFDREAKQMSYKLHCTFNNNNSERNSTRDIFHTSKGEYNGLTVGDVVREIKEKSSGKFNEDTIKFDVRAYLEYDDILDGEGKPDWTGIPRNIVRYMLFRMCDTHGSELWDRDIRRPELEHIRPESKLMGDRSNKVQSLGNLSILERKINIDCDDKPYRDKTKLYDESEFDMVDNISTYSQRKWSDEHIENRRDDLIDQFFALH